MNYIIASYYTSGIDPQRGTAWQSNLEAITEWIKSGISLCEKSSDIRLLLTHDNLTQEMVEAIENPYLDIIKVEPCGTYSPNEYRWIIYKNLVENNLESFDRIFFTDVSDVIIKNNPFTDMKEGVLYIGDEKENWGTGWIQSRSHHHMQYVEGYAALFEKEKNSVLLNCGLVGGTVNTILKYLTKVEEIEALTANKSKDTTDMITSNYVAKAFFEEVVHGAPVNSVFKAYQNSREDVWFIHK